MVALTDSLISYWKLDETSGTRADSHSTNHLTDGNTVGYEAGKSGNAASFVKTSNERLYIADNAGLSGGDVDFTFALWVLCDADFAAYSVVAGKSAQGDYEAAGWEYGFLRRAAVLYFIVGNNSTYKSATINFGTFPTDGWHFAVGWHDSTANTVNLLWDNTTLGSSAYTGGSYDGGGVFALGSRGADGAGGCNTAIDCVGFWKRVLTEAERTTLYGAGTPPEYPWVTATGNPFIIRAPIPSWCH